MEPREVLQSNLALIDAVIDRVCRRARLHGPDAEDFAASVKLALVENDYAILRRFEGRALLSTYLTIIVERLLADERSHARGRWHPSSKAVRLGAAAILLESLVVRGRRTLDEALPLVQSIDAAMTRQWAEAFLAELPERRPRPVATDLDHVPAAALAVARSADSDVLAKEARRLSECAAGVVRHALAALPLEDRMLIRFRFGASMSIADISRMLRLPQRPLYRRLESLLQGLRDALEAEGLDGTAAAHIIETSAADELDFGLLENDAERQTKQSMERA